MFRRCDPHREQIRQVVHRTGRDPGGITAAHLLRKRGITDFVILERGDDVGGTGRDNHYPARRYPGSVSSDAVVSSQTRPAAPPSARRRDRRPEQTIRKVLDAGLEELRESSYSTLTMRAVAGRAGVSPASAYTYFPSKSALVAAVYLRLLRATPVHTDVNQTTKVRVSTTMREMALVVANEPELAAACSAALMTARFLSFDQIAGQLADAVDLVLGQPDQNTTV